jgi:hypothetical protein
MSITYWGLNEVYILITVVILVLFIIPIYYLFTKFQIEMAKELNDCTNPLAVYFDDDVRNRCLTAGLAKNKDVKKLQEIDKEAREEAKRIRGKFAELAKHDEASNSNYDSLQARASEEEAPQLLAAKQAFLDLSGAVASIKSQYLENTATLKKTMDEYENTFNKNIEFIIGVGNSLVNKLYSNIYTKKFQNKRKAMVDNYNKIRAYLEKVGQPKGVLRDLTQEEIAGK